MNLEINEEERAFLLSALGQYLSELRGEIRHTDDHEFKRILKKNQDIVRSLQSKLGEAQAQASSQR